MLEEIKNINKEDHFCLEAVDKDGFKLMLKTPINWKKIEFLNVNELKSLSKLVKKKDFKNNLLMGLNSALIKVNTKEVSDEFLNVLNNIIVITVDSSLQEKILYTYKFYLEHKSVPDLLNDILTHRGREQGEIVETNRRHINMLITNKLINDVDTLYYFIISSKQEEINNFCRITNTTSSFLYERILKELYEKNNNEKGVVLFNNLNKKQIFINEVSLINRVMEMMVKVPHIDKSLISRINVLNYFSSMNKDNMDKKMETIRFFNYNIWSESGFLLKCLYNQSKNDLILKLVTENEIDLEQYDKFYIVMEKRANRYSQDFEHVEENIAPLAEKIRMKKMLEKEIPNMNNNKSKMVKF